MKIALLNQTHPTYDAETWRRYDALYRGGRLFRDCIGEFLPRNPMEDEGVFLLRSRGARYTNYVGPIVDWFAARLMAAPMTATTAPDSPAPGPWYATWKTDVDGQGTDLKDFARARFVDACVKGRSWWRVRLRGEEQADRAPANAAEWEAMGLGDVLLQALDREQVLDWQADDYGNLEWVIVHETERPRRSPAESRGATVHRWTLYTADEIQVFETAVKHGEALDERTDLAPTTRPNLLKRIPLIGMGFDGARAVHVQHKRRDLSLTASEIFGLWPLNRLADPQIAHFLTEAGLDWSIARTCYAMPVFAGDDNAAPPTMGAGYYIKLGRGETFTWVAPPTGHLTVAEQRAAARRDELYRVANQMAQGVDNNSAAALGRSGDSKRADQESTEALLTVYGAMLLEAVQKTYEFVSAARGDELRWVVTGLDQFQVLDPAALTETAVASRSLDIQSPTFRREIDKRVALALLPDAEEAVRVQISKEIDTLTTGESVVHPSKPGDDADDGEGDEKGGEAEDEREPASTPAPAPGARPAAARRMLGG